MLAYYAVSVNAGAQDFCRKGEAQGETCNLRYNAAMGIGRPSVFSETIETAILDRLSAGESLLKICETEGFPNRSTVIRWMSSNPGFATKCAHAREHQADVMDERILEVANQVLAGTVDPHAGKVAISAFEWRAAKLKPKVYGDAQLIKHADADGNALKIEVTRIADTPRQLSASKVIDVGDEKQ